MIWCQRKKKMEPGTVTLLVGNKPCYALRARNIKIMGDHGCAHLVYGYEHFDDKFLKTMGKGSTRKKI